MAERRDGSRPLRVLLLIDAAADLGGAERFVVGLAEHLPRDRVEPWVCSTRTAQPRTSAALDAMGVANFSLGRRSKRDLHRLWPLLSLLRSARIDVIHSHMFGSNLWGVLLGRLGGVPVLLPHEHVWSYAGDPARSWLDGQLIGRLATRFVTISQQSRTQMIELEGVAADKVVVMPTAYIPHPGGGANLRAELGIAPDAPVVGVAAVLRPQKALEVMLDAHRRLLARLPDAHLVIAGDGECGPALRAEAQALGIGGRVHFLGMREDVDALLHQVDVAAMSSDWEGMPLFALESMAAGVPLVATAVGGLPELVSSGENGLLVPARDPQALADALCRVLSDGELAARLAAGARLRVQAYGIESVAARFADLYHQLYGECRRLPALTPALG